MTEKTIAWNFVDLAGGWQDTSDNHEPAVAAIAALLPPDNGRATGLTTEELPHALMVEAERAGSKWESLPGYGLALQARVIGQRPRHSSEVRRGRCFVRITPAQHGGARAGSGAKRTLQEAVTVAVVLGRQQRDKISAWMRLAPRSYSQSEAIRALIDAAPAPSP